MFGGQETQVIKWEAWTPSQDGEEGKFWNNAAVEDTLREPSCFKMEEVESCTQDISSIAFLPSPEETENKPDDVDEVDEEKSPEENQENNEPSTSAQLELEEREPETSRRDEDDNRQEEPPAEPADNENAENRDTSMEPRPFSCSLCSAKFPRKLLLSAHVEKRHGVKYVFTERGKKVKLVRMPEIVKKGDKLDPFVELLLKKNAGLNQKSKDSNAILVQPVDPNSAFTGVAEELDPQDIFKNILGDDANCGILVDNLDTTAYIEVCKKGEVPFVAFGSLFTENHALLRIIQLNEQKQILVPATSADIKNTKGIMAVVNRSDNTPCTFEQARQEAAAAMEIEQTEDHGTQSNDQPEEKGAEATDASVSNKANNGEAEPAPDLSNLSIVAYADVVLNKELKQFQIAVTSPAKDDVIKNQFIKFDEFRDMVLLCKPKRLRCLSELYPNEGEISAPETNDNQSSHQKPKRKYTRRNYIKENQARAMAEAANAASASNESLLFTPPNNINNLSLINQDDELEKPKKGDGDDEDDEEKDATYNPALERAPKKRRTYAARRISAKRRLDFEDCVNEEEEGNKENVAPSIEGTDGNGDTDGHEPNMNEKLKKAKAAELKQESLEEQKENPSSDSEQKETIQPKRRRGRPPKTVLGM